MEAAVAVGHAAEAAAYAAEEKDRAAYLSEVAAADEAAAQRAEAEYIALEGIYQRKQQEAKNRSTAHKRKPEPLKTRQLPAGPTTRRPRQRPRFR